MISTGNPRLALRDISHTYQRNGQHVQALDDVSLHAAPGEFLTLIGPSGSGKSTLLQIIAGLLQPDTGTVYLNDKPHHKRLGATAYMPQQDALLPWRTVLDNVIVGPEVSGSNRRAAKKRAHELLPLFGLEGFADSFPAELSGGMRQRAALLRTFLTGRDILLLDEPFGALDALTRRDLQAWLLDVWQHFDYTIIFITHDVEEAVFLSDRVLVLSPRPGKVVFETKIALQRPRHEHYGPFDQAMVKHQSELFHALKGSP
jgi:ABC-type nitrate/sulfonate/bicarbonate transport system ATPase subunit